MLNFILYDKNGKYIEKNKKVIENYNIKYDFEIKNYLYQTKEKLLYNLNSIKGHNIIFLASQNEFDDILFEIRYNLKDWNSKIICITDNDELDKLSLYEKYGIFNIITNDNYYEKKINESINKIIVSLQNRENCLRFKFNRVIRIIEYKDIIYIEKEKDNKKCLINTNYGTYKIGKSISFLIKELGNNFIKINRSTIINSDYVVYYNYANNELSLKDGSLRTDVARDSKKLVEEKLMSQKRS